MLHLAILNADHLVLDLIFIGILNMMLEITFPPWCSASDRLIFFPLISFPW